MAGDHKVRSPPSPLPSPTTPNSPAPAVPRLPIHLYPAPACRPTYAFSLVSSFPQRPPDPGGACPTFPRSPHRLPPLSPPDTGDRPYKCQHCGDQFARRLVSIFSRFLPSSLSLTPVVDLQRPALKAYQQVPCRRETPNDYRTFSPQGHRCCFPRNHFQAGL